MKNKIILAFGFIFCFQKIPAQQVGHTTITFADPSRNNRQIETEIYYPAITAGDNTPIATGVFPVISFGHGFVMTWSAYHNFRDALVAEGYILALPTSESGFAPSHADFGEDLRFIITKIQASGAGAIIPASSVGTTSAIMGHSMGGGSSFLGAANNTTITTMVSFAAANTNPSSITAAQQVSVPTLLFSGSNDCVTPPAQHQDIMYDSTSAAYKTQVYIKGGGHCYFANSNFNCSFGEGTCSPAPAISRNEQQATVNDLLKLWLAYFLKGDCAKAKEFQDSLSASSRISYRQSQSIACPTGITESHAVINFVSVYPNPAGGFLNIDLHREKLEHVIIYDVTKQKAFDRIVENPGSKTPINISSLKEGIYFILINDKYWAKFLKN